MLKNALLAMLAAALAAHMWLWLPHIYANGVATANDATGQVWPLNRHGVTIYVTRLEHLAQSVFTPTLFAATFAAGVWNHISRRRSE